MSKTPIYDNMTAWREEIYTQARLEAEKGLHTQRQQLLEALKAVKRPTKPMMDLIKELDNANG